MKKLKQFKVPHSLAIVVFAMVLASLLTWLIPGGSFERIVDEAGKTVVVPGSYHTIEPSPVNPLTILGYVFDGLTDAGDIIFALMCAGGGLGIVLATGMFQGAACTFAKKAKGAEWLVIAVLMTVFTLLCIPINLNYFIPFAPLGIIVAMAMGYDPIVGISIIMLGGAVGFSTGAMNLATTGTAQGIAELPVFSGMGYRLFCIIPFLIVTVIYVIRYGRKIKADPTKSYTYNVPLDLAGFNPDETPAFEKKHIPVAIVVVASIGYMIYVALFSSLSYKSSATIFLYMGLLSGIVYSMPVNQMCKEFSNGAKGMAGTGVLIGFAYAISGILEAGNVMDTVVNAMANMLNYVPDLFQAPAMFLMHLAVNLFITSGSGQAAIVMPIFVPVADLVGMTRQTAVLAYNFGDGFANFIMPHAAATMGFVACANIPFTKWFQYVFKLFLIWVVVGIALLMIATAIGYS